MSFKPFKWIRNHPWETAGIAAAAALGGPALFAEGGILGGGTAAGGISSAYGGLLGSGAGAGIANLASNALVVPQAAGEDFAATMAGQSMAAPQTSGLFDNFSGQNLLKGAYYANKANGLLESGQQQRTPFASASRIQQVPVTNTILPTTPTPGTNMMDPKMMALLKQLMQQQQGSA